MHRGVILPVVVGVLSAAACGGDHGSTGVAPKARVRFFNATTGMTGSGGFTANAQFATGSALAFGQSTPACLTVNAGATSFGFGEVNAGGTGLSGSALATLNSQSIATGGNYTVVATGFATNPALFLLDNSISGSLGANQAAVRFVNLAPGTEASPNNFAVFIGTFGSGGVLHATNPAVGEPTTFTTLASGSTAFSVLWNHELPPAISGTSGTLNLPAGSVNTVAIVPNTSGGFQLINLPRC